MIFRWWSTRKAVITSLRQTGIRYARAGIHTILSCSCWISVGEAINKMRSHERYNIKAVRVQEHTSFHNVWKIRTCLSRALPTDAEGRLALARLKSHAPTARGQWRKATLAHVGGVAPRRPPHRKGAFIFLFLPLIPAAISTATVRS